MPLTQLQRAAIAVEIYMAGSKPSTLKGQQQKKRGKLSQEYVSDDDDGSDADVKPKANKVRPLSCSYVRLFCYKAD